MDDAVDKAGKDQNEANNFCARETFGAKVGSAL